MSELIAIISLSIFNLWQLWFWSRSQSKLVDKIMSRNYAEYKQVEQSISSPIDRTQHAQSSEDETVLRELNSMLGGT